VGRTTSSHFLRSCREELETEAVPLLSQAEGYRARLAQRELKAEAEKANERVAETVQKEVPRVLEQQSATQPFLSACPSLCQRINLQARVLLDVDHRGAQWRIPSSWRWTRPSRTWLTITDKPSSRGTPREITVRMSLVHPFMQQFCRADSAEIEALARIAAALGLAEITARDAGVAQYGNHPGAI